MCVRCECKFTPLGFETFEAMFGNFVFPKCKFTPLGFETARASGAMRQVSACKFTPLGFETVELSGFGSAGYCVNLPRWGLKQKHFYTNTFHNIRCKFTPLGFETR